MELPALIQEKVLAGLDLQIRNAKSDPALEWQDRDSLLASLCLGPWDVATLFRLPSTDPTSVIDRYGLHAVATVDLHLTNFPREMDLPENVEWATDIDAFHSIPLFSPLDVWKALQRKECGDLGLDPPPIRCDADRLLRNVCRGYRSAMSCVGELAEQSHDKFLLAAALSDNDPAMSLSWLEKAAAQHSVWNTSSLLEGEAAEKYWRDYSNTPLKMLWETFGLATGHRKGFRVEWISPEMIPLIELELAFQNALKQPRWLLYKAVAVLKGQLPEEEHNRMLAEAMTDDISAKAYVDFLKTATA